MEETPVWDLFKRIESLEAIVPTLRDARGIAFMAFVLSFYYSASLRDHPRMVKDYLVDSFKGLVSPETLKVLEKTMLGVCKVIEEERQQK